MPFRLNIRLRGRTLTITGLAGLLLLAGLFVLPHLLAATLSPERARDEIRAHLKRRVMDRHMVELRASGASLPDAGTAGRWKSDLQRLDRIAIRPVEIRHFLLVPPFTSSRVFVVRAGVPDETGRRQTRYFSLSAENRFFEFFWVNEQSRWMWWLSI